MAVLKRIVISNQFAKEMVVAQRLAFTGFVLTPDTNPAPSLAVVKLIPLHYFAFATEDPVVPYSHVTFTVSGKSR